MMSDTHPSQERHHMSETKTKSRGWGKPLSKVLLQAIIQAADKPFVQFNLRPSLYAERRPGEHRGREVRPSSSQSPLPGPFALALTPLTPPKTMSPNFSYTVNE